MATKHNAFFDPQKQTSRGYFPTLKEFDGVKWGDGSETADAPYEAFQRSCHNIMAMWQGRQQSRIYVPANNKIQRELLPFRQLELFSPTN